MPEAEPERRHYGICCSAVLRRKDPPTLSVRTGHRAPEIRSTGASRVEFGKRKHLGIECTGHCRVRQQNVIGSERVVRKAARVRDRGV